MRLNEQKMTQVNIAIDVALLAKLIESEQLCAADVSALDTQAHEMIRHLLLEVCSRKLRGNADGCAQCAAQAFCQQAVSAHDPLPISDYGQRSFSVH